MTKWQKNKKKICNKCKIEKSLNQFYKCKLSKNGVRSTCKKCLNLQSENWHNNNKEYVKKKRDDNYTNLNLYAECWRQNNKKYAHEYGKKHYIKNKEHKSLYVKKCRQENPEKFRLRNKIYKKNNPEISLNYQSRRRQRCNFKVSKNENERINLFYKNRPPGYEVDHIIPLLGNTVSGLHVLSNLQYLTMSENRQKSNHFNKNGTFD